MGLILLWSVCSCGQVLDAVCCCLLFIVAACTVHDTSSNYNCSLFMFIHECSHHFLVLLVVVPLCSWMEWELHFFWLIEAMQLIKKRKRKRKKEAMTRVIDLATPRFGIQNWWHQWCDLLYWENVLEYVDEQDRNEDNVLLMLGSIQCH